MADDADDFVEVSVRTVSVPGGRLLAWHEYGRPGDPALFVFSDSRGTRGLTAGQVEVVRDGRIRVIAPDRPGSGGSSVQRGRRITDWPADVAALADHLGIERFDVFGIGDGSAYALVCAVLLPDRVESVSILDGVAEPTATALAVEPAGEVLSEEESLLRRPWGFDPRDASAAITTFTAGEDVGSVLAAIRARPTESADGTAVNLPISSGTSLPVPAPAPASNVTPGRSRRGVLVGAVGGGAVLLAAIVGVAVFAASSLLRPPLPEPVFLPGALDGIVGFDLPASLGELESSDSPVGWTGQAGGVLAQNLAAYGGTSPAQCQLFAFAEPVGARDAGSTDRVIVVGEFARDDGTYVSAYARVFATPSAAADQVRATREALARCADGYRTPHWEARSLEPEGGPAVDGVAASAWMESGLNAEGVDYVYHAIELRRGNIVIRATCTLIRSPDSSPCDELWSALALRLAGLPGETPTAG